MGEDENKSVRLNQSHVTINTVQIKLLNNVMKSNQQDKNIEKQIFVGMLLLFTFAADAQISQR